MIKTIIFDIGGVVNSTDHKVIYSNFALRVGLSPEIVIDYHKLNRDELILGNITLEQFWEDMKKAGANPDSDFKEIWISEGVKNRKINKELLDIIKKLRKKYSVGALTNLIPTRLIIDERLNLYSNFDYSVLSCVEHLKKPDNPEFYKIALARAGVKPEEAVFIDDREDSVAAAKALGIKAIRYSYPDNLSLIKELKRLGVDTTNLEET